MHNFLLNRYFLILAITLILLGLKPFSSLAVAQATASPTHDPNLPSSTATAGTPSSTFTPSGTPTVTATTTLMPLPAFTLNFPLATSTPPAMTTPFSAARAETPTPSVFVEDQNSSPRIKFLSIVLVIIWLVLAGFLVLYISQLN